MGLDKIVKCNTEKPYIFISYSSCDKEVVWADVQEYQRRGYNIWLDEKNLDKTNSSWKDDAMAAIMDFDCQLVVFYVSRNSLTSEPCFNEMMTTRSDKAKILHEDKPVPFIAVDAEPIGNIIDFKDEIFKEIRGSEKWNKTEKTSKIMVMSKFIEEFFNSNNERVRIHDRTDESYISQYYQEITNYFHPETRNAVAEPEIIKNEVCTEREKSNDVADKRVVSSSAEFKKLLESAECNDDNLKKALRENKILVRISSSDISYREEYLKYDIWLFSLDKSKENADDWEFYILKRGDMSANSARVCFDATDLNVSIEIKNSIRKSHLADVRKVSLTELLSGKWTNCFE